MVLKTNTTFKTIQILLDLCTIICLSTFHSFITLSEVAADLEYCFTVPRYKKDTTIHSCDYLLYKMFIFKFIKIHIVIDLFKVN